MEVLLKNYDVIENPPQQIWCYVNNKIESVEYKKVIIVNSFDHRGKTLLYEYTFSSMMPPHYLTHEEILAVMSGTSKELFISKKLAETNFSKAAMTSRIRKLTRLMSEKQEVIDNYKKCIKESEDDLKEYNYELLELNSKSLED